MSETRELKQLQMTLTTQMTQSVNITLKQQLCTNTFTFDDNAFSKKKNRIIYLSCAVLVR